MEVSTMHGALRAELYESQTLHPVLILTRLNGAKSFIAPENTHYAFQRPVDTKTIYIGYLTKSSGLCIRWTKVLSLSKVTEVEVLPEISFYFVLAKKSS